MILSNPEFFSFVGLLVTVCTAVAFIVACVMWVADRASNDSVNKKVMDARVTFHETTECLRDRIIKLEKKCSSKSK